MTGKSKYSDIFQKGATRLVMNGGDVVSYFQGAELPLPSEWTLKRWEGVWKPIILKEIEDSKKKQDKANRKHHKPNIPKDKQDEKSTFSIPIRFLSDVEEALNTHLSAYNKSQYGAAVRRRERIRKILEIIKEVDK